MKYLSRLEDEISSWQNVSVHPHRFGGKEFKFGKAEIGHVHGNGTVDILHSRAVPRRTRGGRSGRIASLGPGLRLGNF